MQRPDFSRTPQFKSYLVGFVLALVLTGVSFALVATRAAPGPDICVVVFIAAVAQMIVHLHYFLHLNLSHKKQPLLIIALFTLVIVGLMAGGTLWIIYSLNANMG